ncbi:MAG TPA: Smr/MutS family protein [Rhizomicrobium sp.]|nr:Smr/MutS family protein [Rhizomicrobium sp.]
MRRKREASEEEIALFRDTVHGARSAKASKRTTREEIQPVSKFRGAPKDTHSSGIDGNTSERLRRGQLEPEARLDLHGLTEVMAYRRLARFLSAAHGRGLRLVLVVTGKGSATADPYSPFDLELNTRRRGILKMVVPRWLKEPDFAPMVAEMRSAHRRHGGSGALYVYLRKKKG